MTVLLSVVAISASVWVLWQIRRNSSQLDLMEADMTRLLETMEP